MRSVRRAAVPADRATYAHEQARLLRALLRGEVPDGFDAARAAAACSALRRKRARTVARVLPLLALDLGERFERLFDAYALRVAPGSDGAVRDGLRFARSLPDRERLGDAARRELALARARTGSSPLLLVAALRTSRHILVIVRLPLLGVRTTTLRRTSSCSLT